ncbi:MAG TPA: nucleotidyltransferase domain-containing protein [Solirubrobacteraceae bacterium]|nr:nucleotidyltransferase domain-containing protein [Solirubrobacteraceae bacterium]
MDFRHPLWGSGPSLEGDALRILTGADAEFSGRQVHQLIAHSSEEGVRRALNRLVAQGIVQSRKAGQATLYRFNREHLAAPWIEGLMSLRAQLIDRLRSEINGWAIKPVAAAVFGSVARGEARPDSDLDIFLVRPSSVNEDAWEAQIAGLTDAATRWTGNDTRPLELTEDDLPDRAADERVIQDILDHGIEIGGSLRALRKRVSR